jgi:hypothetical protein
MKHHNNLTPLGRPTIYLRQVASALFAAGELLLAI